VSQEQEKEQAAEQLCEQYISQKVSGVFFAPVEFSANRFQSNHKIVAAFDRAGIPVVLLDPVPPGKSMPTKRVPPFKVGL
jgi:DNA-binding LacI/PurR family transcriptional regulator